jgi:hypothetical protein
MIGSFKSGVLVSCLSTFLLQVAVLTAQLSKQTPAAPIPAQIPAAKKVFIANAGGEEPTPDDPQFSGPSDRAYNQFYAAMKIWGRHELVGAPADADLCFEIRFSAPPAARSVFRGDTVGTARFDPQLRLVIRDPKTNAIVWGFTEHASWAILKGNRDKNFDLAMDKIVADVQRLSTQPAAAGSSK